MTETVQHVGRFNSRCNDSSPSGDREAAFIRLWQKENSPPSFMNHGIGVLCWLLHAHYDEQGYQTFDRDEVTQEEATAAATVIQWLGTNCGWDFLNQCVEACGYKLERTK
jgi:hypothetical protein